MYIERILLENIRGFRKLDFSLKRPDGSYAGWTVFTGSNGSGKSALLKAVAMALVGVESTRSLQASLAGWVRSGARTGRISLGLFPTKGDDSFGSPEKDRLVKIASDPKRLREAIRKSPAIRNDLLAHFRSRKELRPFILGTPIEDKVASLRALAGVGRLLRTAATMHLQDVSVLAALEVTNRGKESTVAELMEPMRFGLGGTWGPWADEPKGWFACGYGPFRRTAGSSPDATRLMAGPGRVARFVTLFREDASLSECESWLKELKFRETEHRAEDAAKLELVQQILNDDLLENEFRVDRVDSDGVWLRDRSGLVLPMADISDGYRAVLALVADLLRHLIDVYGIDGLVEKQGGRLVVRRSGVVLIDEIDVHLHPEWQRRIGFWLKERMPRLQFLVASHSPLVCQAADPGGLFRLPAPGSAEAPFQLGPEDYRRVIASRPDTILLSPAFSMRQIRSPLAVRKRQRHAELMAKQAGPGLTARDRREIQELEPFVSNPEE